MRIIIALLLLVESGCVTQTKKPTEQRDFVSRRSAQSIPATGSRKLTWEYPESELPNVRFNVYATDDLTKPFQLLGTTEETEFHLSLDASQHFFRVSAEWKN